MGVPKFFRYVSERYPCLSELVKEFQIPDFDNLYLDMNGIIHNCSHPNDSDPHFSIPEEKIFASIFHYIEVLFNIIKPRKLFFLAVDGVAPRAKMNQQRARRFRTAKEAELRAKQALEKSDVPLPKERFDSNCITPGTVFMDRLHSQLKYFITSKISTDLLWQGCKIILSGHQTPGEGEHKIMDYIRYLKTQPDFDENTRHCLYGLDADLIMLGLCTHEPHFSLLREKVSFTKQDRNRILLPDETEFYLLHLSLLREYLDSEFQELKQTLPFQYNLENIIDDWILMGFLVGNDFIPNLPDLHINKGAFQTLCKAYKEVLPTLDGYLNENGYLNLPRFQTYMEKMAEHDLKAFEDTYANLAFLEEKTGRSFMPDKKANGESGKSSELEELIKATEEALELSDEEFIDEEMDETNENDTFLWEFIQHKKNYYTHKLDYSNVTPEVLKSQAEGYIRAIQWNLHYYYQGCQSWSWYYPHHYAPYISDIKDFKDLKLNLLDFDMGKPFLPFEQLLAVLPAASKNLLPDVYWDLMTSPNSPIKDFYPEDFETDLNGKQQDWEAVVLIPFIDEKRLLEAMEPCNEKLTTEERRRNQHGPMHVFTYTEDDLGAYKSLDYFPTILSNHALMVDVLREEIAVEKCYLKYGLRPGVLLDVLYPAFPTLKHIPHTVSLKASKVKVFEFPSLGENMILTLTKREFGDLNVLADDLLGKIVYVNWPHLVESRAIAVSNEEKRFYLLEDSRIEVEVFGKQKRTEWLAECENIRKHYLGRLGIELGDIDVIVHVLPLDGTKVKFGPMGKVVTERIWSVIPTACAVQVIVKDFHLQDRRVRHYTDFRDAFSVGSVVFMLGQPHFGSKGRVLDSTDSYKNSRLRVELETENDPFVHESLLQSETKAPFVPCRVAALKVGINPRVLGRITGSVLVSMINEESLTNPGSKINIGLNMKFHKKNEEIPGYSKKENDNWLYSLKAVDVMAAYVEKFSRVVEHLSLHQNTSVFFVQDIFPGPDGVTEMKEMVSWIKAQEYNQLERVRCGTKVLEPHIVAKIEEIVAQTPKNRLTRQMQVKPHLLYKDDLVFGNVPPVKSARHKLLDRVVAIRSSYTVPTGLRGFIISIHPAPKEEDNLYDVLFDSPFLSGMTLYSSSPHKCFRMSRVSFLNISDANRLGQRTGSSVMGPAVITNLSLYGEAKTSAFAQWNHNPPRPVAHDNNEEFKKMWTSLLAAKPQEEALKKILKIEKKEIEDPVKSFFEKVTKSSNNAPGPFTQSVNTAPRNKFYLQLFSYHQKQGLGQPRFKYLHLGGKVMAQVIFADGKVYSGLPSDDKESACESASLQALGALGEIPLNNEALIQKEKEKKILENQRKLNRVFEKASIPNRKPNHQLTNAKMPPLLPNPPLQWVGPIQYARAQGVSFNPPKDNVHGKGRNNSDKPQNPPNAESKKLNASALEFVPLQVFTGKRNLGKIATVQIPKMAEAPKRTEAAPTLMNNPGGGSSSTTKPRRRPKIAAKLNLDPNLY